MATCRVRAGGRPRVLILGGGFAGIGAARELKKADVDVVLVDKHDYHTFQPLLYQVATALLEPSAVGHPLRDLFHEQPNVERPRGRPSRASTWPSARSSSPRWRRSTYDYLVLALGAEVNFFGAAGAPEHAFPMYTLADAVRLKEHVLGKWEAADKDAALVEDGALHVVVVGGGPTGVESAGALAELYGSNFAEDYPDMPAEHARITLVEASPHLFGMFKENLREYTKQALEERGVEVLLGEIVESVEPTRVTLKSGKVLEAHTLVWGAGLQANPIAGRARARARAGQPRRRRAGSQHRGPPGGVRRRRHRLDHRHEDRRGAAPARLGRAPGGGAVRARTSPGSSPGKETSRSATTTRARWRRSAAEPRSSSCRAGGR